MLMRSPTRLARYPLALAAALACPGLMGGCSDEGKKDGTVAKTDEKQQQQIQGSMKDFMAKKGKSK
jgi:hypothetical protein